MSPSPQTNPAPAIVELDGWSIEPFTAEDAPLLAELLSQRGHRYVLDVPADEATLAAMLGEVARHPWTMPVGFIWEESLAGFATTALPNLRALHVSVAALFVDPAEGRLPLAMYLRHVFWSFPLERLHTQIPSVDLTREYVDLLLSVGFVDEGRLLRHAAIAGQHFDVVTLGLLRADFEQWCGENEPRLTLA